MFTDRVKSLSSSNQPDIQLEVSGPAIAPASTPSYMLRPSTPLQTNGASNSTNNNKDLSDATSMRSYNTSRSSYSGLPPPTKAHSVHVIASSERGSSAGSVGGKRGGVRSGAASGRSVGAASTGAGSTYTVTMSRKGYAKSVATVETDWSYVASFFCLYCGERMMLIRVCLMVTA